MIRHPGLLIQLNLSWALDKIPFPSMIPTPPSLLMSLIIEKQCWMHPHLSPTYRILTILHKRQLKSNPLPHYPLHLKPLFPLQRKLTPLSNPHSPLKPPGNNPAQGLTSINKLTNQLRIIPKLLCTTKDICPRWPSGLSRMSSNKWVRIPNTSRTLDTLSHSSNSSTTQGINSPSSIPTTKSTKQLPR